MGRRLALLLIAVVAGAQQAPTPEILVAGLLEADGLDLGALDRKDRTLLRSREKTKHLFPKDEPHLLSMVRQTLDRPLATIDRLEPIALGLARAPGLMPDGLELFYRPTPKADLAAAGVKLTGGEDLDPQVRTAIATLHATIVTTNRAVLDTLAPLKAEDRALLQKTLPAWLGRASYEDKEALMRGEEDEEERIRLVRCAQLWAGLDHGRMSAAWRELLRAVEAAIPVLKQQPHFIPASELKTEAGTILLRGHGNDDGFVDQAVLVVDFGGDDQFKMPETPASLPVRVLIDLGGDDLYLSRAPFSWGAALLGVSLLYDAGGDDDYRAGDWSLGCGLGGHGALFDGGGRDRYHGGLGAQGVGIFGTGVLKDTGGDDEYVAGCFCQGFGSTGGLGALLDAGGDDTYLAGRDSPDLWRREGTFVTFAQGSGYGHRFGTVVTNEKGGRSWRTTAQIPGGIGLLADAGGNDRYEADVFGQGSAYWYSLGMLVDGGGNDRYRATWYGQGVGTHAATGCVVDVAGDDWYFSRNTSQGCGHDFSVGYLRDRAGNDTYRAMMLSQGAGNAMGGLGVLVDDAGDDAYHCSARAWGFAAKEPRDPAAAPFAFFLDLGGTERYTGSAAETRSKKANWKQGDRGYGMDLGTER